MVRTRLHFPLVIVGLPWLKTIWQNEAPDFWSVRTLVVEATPHGKPEAPWLATEMDEAFRVLQQAVAMAADLARQDPGRFTELAAQSFALWAGFIWFMGRYAEGVTAASQSVLCWRGVPNRSAAQLAEALLLESFCRVGASDLSGGERAARHAVEILHAEGNAAPKLTLAKALKWHGSTFIQMRDPESAMVRFREAIRWIQAAGDMKADPDGIALLVTCHGDLATSLLLSGRLQEAIDQATEGVAVARDASVVHGDRIRHVLAAALGKWVACLGAAGRQGEAWAHALEVVELRRAMARQDGSVAEREMLALALRMLAKCEADLGLPGAALARLREALHWRNPDLGHPSSPPPPLDRIAAEYLGLLRQLGREPDPSGPEAFLAPWLGGRRASAPRRSATQLGPSLGKPL